METVHSGGRPLTRAALAGRRRALEDGRTVSRRELSAAGRDAAKALNLRPALRSILSALCAVWGEQDWERLVVWPSNEHLCGMTGLSERALRYGLRDLVALEVITPRDSANGKRFAIRGPGGAVIDAYGFDLTPIVARKGEWATAIMDATARDAQRSRAFDLLTVRRRAVSEALAALRARFPATDAADLLAAQEALERSTPRRRASGMGPDVVLDAWGELQVMAEERFYQAASAGNSGRHIEQDTGSPTDPCAKAPEKEPEPTRRLEPSLVAAACPVAAEFGVTLRTEADVIEIGRLMRGGIGAHPSAWSEACQALGPFRASVLVLIVAQLHDDDVRRGEIRIKNPGGYFRQLVRLCSEGRYGLEAELMAMRRRKMT
ncbi:replication initiation protein RepC [Methylobacterium sp. UNC300MFChir4.1]|uniref:replication initiation protein RepC n=1 Tax=Methylobacterium sp. UNC300MFChir4.1 TaxID=1502747 RepID=UPI0008C0DE5D|nr:replication initiation protein RepC [Methylobacterium sp. UNC300MFChir4.1]SEP35657.1 replication initiation protein RepC [Methylobacterium sp. UNC300MFChir4.1]